MTPTTQGRADVPVEPPVAPEPAALPPGVRLGRGTDLGGSSRSQVRRHEVLDGPAGWGRSVVVKRFVPQPAGSRAAMGYGRELAGLALLPGTPRLLASDDSTQTLVMEDLGAQAPTLADVLLGRDGVGAWRHTVAWAGALGATVRADAEVLAAARRRLGDAVAEDRQTRRDYPRRALLQLREVAGVRHAAAATAQVLDVVDWLEQDTRRHVLGPGDTCPDNAVLTPAGVRFLDLEGAGVRHVAFEAAYAAEPFSTCWCVFTPPGGLTGAMLGAFTDAASAELPGLREDPQWPRQVRAAAAVWVLSATLWLLDGALEDRTLIGGGDVPRGPAFRALLVSRWRWVVRECADELPDVAAVCDEAITWALRSWRGSLELPGYPAWRRG
jgi:hypothetical protein